MKDKGNTGGSFLGILYVVTRLCLFVAAPFFQASVLYRLPQPGRFLLTAALNGSSTLMILALIYFTTHKKHLQRILHTLAFVLVTISYCGCVYASILTGELLAVIGAAAVIVIEICWMVYVFKPASQISQTGEDDRDGKIRSSFFSERD